MARLPSPRARVPKGGRRAVAPSQKPAPVVRIASTRNQFPMPPSKRWTGVFPGEFAGTIFTAKAIDLQRSTSRLAVADSMTAATTSSSLSNLNAPVAFLRTAADSTDRYWALASAGRLFKTSGTNPKTGWAQDAIASSPTDANWDIIEFASAMICGRDADLARLSSGTWTNAWWTVQSGASALQSGKPHRFGILAAALLITDGRYIHTWDGTLATQNALTLPSQFQAQFIVTTQDLAFIGTKSLNGGNAEVFSWDRSSSTFNARYDIGDSECLCGFSVSGIPYIVTKQGYIKRFTGTGFMTVQQLPSAEIPTTINNIDANGVSVVGNVVKMLVDFGTALTNTRLRSGLWTFEADTLNLYHSGSIKNNNGLDYSQQEIAKAGAVKATLPGSGRYLIGGQAYTAYSGSSIHGIFTLDESSSANRAYFMTVKLKSADVRRFWRQFFLRFPIFQASTDRVRAAYRIKEDINLPQYETVTWVSTTTFTGTNANVAVGDFVEVIAGDNAGALAKITNIAPGSPNTYTIDLALNSSSSTSRVCYHRFIDLGTISSQSVQEQVFRPAARANWIQFLIELRGGINSPQLDEIVMDGSDVPF